MIDLIRKHHLFIDGVTVSGGKQPYNLALLSSYSKR